MLSISPYNLKEGVYGGTVMLLSPVAFLDDNVECMISKNNSNFL